MVEAVEERPCFSCGAIVPTVDGPTHEYMLSSPGCWAVYGEVLAREYQDPAFAALHRLTVDAYAVQHPGEPVPAARRSVFFHLMSLCLVLERGCPPREATEVLQRLGAEKPLPEWLEPPEARGRLTVVDVHGVEGPEAHVTAVERWARSAWNAWSEHHDRVRSSVGDLVRP